MVIILVIVDNVIIRDPPIIVEFINIIARFYYDHNNIHAKNTRPFMRREDK